MLGFMVTLWFMVVLGYMVMLMYMVVLGYMVMLGYLIMLGYMVMLVGYATGFDHPVLWLISMIAVIVFNTVVLGPLFLDDKKGTKDVY